MSTHPYETLTPDVVLDALASVGLHGDGRLMGLSSYENRVYQAHLEEPCQGHDAVVVKFYRPGRWSDAQILEEHAFAAELMAAEVPAVGPLVLQGRTLHPFGGFGFSVSPRRGGRAPELDDPEVLEWIGRFLARIHTVGSARPFATRPALDVQTFAHEPLEWLVSHDAIPLDMQAQWIKAAKIAIDLIAGYVDWTGATAQKASNFGLIRLHGDCHPGNILWTPTDLPAVAPTSWTWTMPAPAPPCKTCGCCCPVTTAANRRRPCQPCWTATSSSARLTGASCA
jgi:Ser/Thr protein kinase RdoA (MazF antagonist)